MGFPARCMAQNGVFLLGPRSAFSLRIRMTGLSMSLGVSVPSMVMFCITNTEFHFQHLKRIWTYGEINGQSGQTCSVSCNFQSFYLLFFFFFSFVCLFELNASLSLSLLFWRGTGDVGRSRDCYPSDCRQVVLMVCKHGLLCCDEPTLASIPDFDSRTTKMEIYEHPDEALSLSTLTCSNSRSARSLILSLPCRPVAACATNQSI